MLDPPPDPRLSPERLARLESLLGHRFRERAWLCQALRHSSARQAGLVCNERLEFLGDAVLGFLVSMYLFDAHPDHDEGKLSGRRSALVSGKALAQAARALGLQGFLITGPGLGTEGSLPDKLLADAMEALVGALFADGGVEAAWGFVARHLLARRGQGVENHKALLQKLAQAHGQRKHPIYREIGREGPHHDPVFRVVAELLGRSFGPGLGKSLKDAEQQAAAMALAALEAEGQEAGREAHDPGD